MKEDNLFDFSQVSLLLKQGRLLRRESWSENSFIAIFEETIEGEYIMETMILMTIDNKITSWMPTHSDILATDWKAIPHDKN